MVNQPQVHEVSGSWGQILKESDPDRVLVGEIFEPQRQSRYILPDQLNMAFALIRARWDANLWRRSIKIDLEPLREPGVAPSCPLSTHTPLPPTPPHLRFPLASSP